MMRITKGDKGQTYVCVAYPGQTWERSHEIKASYNPTNLIRLNQNIPPAKEE